MAIKPWYKVVNPREDLREGRPIDASEFAVHLDHVRNGRAPSVYQNPEEFFERTFLTKNLTDLAVQSVRRLNGVKVETSSIFNLATQFGGGKTHALTLLYHLARTGDEAKKWKGVEYILGEAGVTGIPKAATAVFVGTEFDSLAGRGGDDGTSKRNTPWGEIAFQLAGEAGLSLVAEHEKQGVAPGGDVISKLIPEDQPTLILLDELMNYVNRSRRSGLSSQLYTFLHNLTEVAPARDNLVLAVSIPASELEMTAEDQSDFDRFKKLLDRRGKAIVMSAETESSEIIRRRLFEWHGLPADALKTITSYETWLQTNRHQIPDWFPVDRARDEFKASYPFHPSVLSVFERKWQGLPRFQQTRGVLRLLALWVSSAYTKGYKGAHKDPLISLGTAPVENPLFRAAMFEQLGESRLEPAVTTDIAGKEHAHATRLDAEATKEIKKARLHRKVATTVFFESNGGQQRGEATVPEVRLAVAAPELDIGNVEHCLEALADTCYYLATERNKYRFSFQPNLNKLLADRRATITIALIEERVKEEIQEVFRKGPRLERVCFPQKSGDIPDRASLTLVIGSTDLSAREPGTAKFLSELTTQSGSSSRTFKSALIWCVADSDTRLKEEGRKLLAWKDIQTETATLKLDDAKARQLSENVKKAERDLRETVWRTYKNVFLLAEDNSFRRIDLGLVHSSAAPSLVDLILTRLKEEDIVVEGVSPNFLTRYWPPALPEWSTKSVRDAFYASPKFPRLLDPDALKRTISRGLDTGVLAYANRAADGGFNPFYYKKSLAAADIEFDDNVFVLGQQRAEEYLAAKAAELEPPPEPPPPPPPRPPDTLRPDDPPPKNPPPEPPEPPPVEEVAGFAWTGDVPAQKWMNFYTKVLTRFVTAGGLKLKLTFEVQPDGGVGANKLEEAQVALRELGLDDAVRILKKSE